MGACVLVDTHFRRVGEVFDAADFERLHKVAEVVWGRNGRAPAKVIEAAREKIEVIVAANWTYGKIQRFPRLRSIIEVSGRFPDADILDYDACFERGIQVLSCAPAFAPIVAEMGLALALAGVRGVASGDRVMREGTEHYYGAGNSETVSLYGQPVGFIGYGNIARALQPLLAPFRCPIRVYDPWLTAQSLCDQGVLPADLETLLAASKVIFVLAAPNETNRHMLGRSEMEQIASGALLVLLSRAHVVDFEALTDLLYAGRFHAAIDVFPIEPLPLDHAIRRAPNTVLSAHRAGSDANGTTFIGRRVVDDLQTILAGGAPKQLQVADADFIRARGTCKV